MQDNGCVDEDIMGVTFASLMLGDNVGATMLSCLDAVGNFGGVDGVIVSCEGRDKI